MHKNCDWAVYWFLNIYFCHLDIDMAIHLLCSPCYVCIAGYFYSQWTMPTCRHLKWKATCYHRWTASHRICFCFQFIPFPFMTPIQTSLEPNSVLISMILTCLPWFYSQSELESEKRKMAKSEWIINETQRHLQPYLRRFILFIVIIMKSVTFRYKVFKWKAYICM